MKAGVFSPEDRTESVRPLAVGAVVQRLTDQAPLDRVVGRCSDVRDGHRLVICPTEVQ